MAVTVISAGKILVLRSDRLGDIVLSSGYLACLSETVPDAQIDVWLSPDTATCAQILHPSLRVRALPFSRFLQCDDDTLQKWIRQIEGEGYELAIIPQYTLGFPEVALLAYSNIGQRWGFRNYELGVKPEWVFQRLGPPQNEPSEWIPAGPAVEPFSSEVSKYHALAEAQGLVSTTVEPRMFQVPLCAQELRSGTLIWPGCGVEQRRWPADRFAELVRALEYSAIIVGGTAAERSIIEDLCGYLEHLHVSFTALYRDECSLRETVTWLSSFQQVLTNDTGIAHLAAAAGVQVLAISGSQHEGRFVLNGAGSLTVFANVPCRRCNGLCLFHSTPYPCVNEITTAPVAALMREGRTGPQYVNTRLFSDREQLFANLRAARAAEEDVLQSEHLQWHATAHTLRKTLDETERQSTTWKQLYVDVQRQCDTWREMCDATVRERDTWRDMCNDTVRQRDALELCYRDSETLVEHFYRHFPWARTTGLPDTSQPKISIITPSFQQGGFIEETIQSVLAQQYPRFEHIVVDGGSTDQTVSILQQYPHLLWFSEPDNGQAHAINKGLLMSTGDIVAYLNSDDVYLPGAFAAVVQFFNEHPDTHVVAGDCVYMNERSETTGLMKARLDCVEDLIRYWGWDKWYCLPQPSVFIRRGLLAQIGLFDSSLHMAMDYDMWLRAARVSKIGILPHTLSAFRLTPNTKTTSRTYTMYYEELLASRRHWNMLPLVSRMGVAMEAHRHLSSKLLAVAEHYVLNGLEPQLVPSLLLGTVRHWPAAFLYPRLILTAMDAIIPGRYPRHFVERLHRLYLGLKWRVQHFRKSPARVA